MSKVYNSYFDIEHMVDTAIAEHICFVIAVSEDKERGAGKTYSSAKMFYNRFKERGERVMIFVRDVNEIEYVANGIFGKFLTDNHPDTRIEVKTQSKIFSYINLITGGGEERKAENIGFCVSLKNAKKIKECRGIFESANVKYFYMDEFMPLDGKYLKNETTLMKTIYDTVNGQIEDLPIIMTANCISLGNPYFTMLKLNGKIQSNTRKLKTDTCIYENVTVKGLAEKHINSAANRAFGQTDEKYTSNVWIGDNNSLVCKPEGWGRAIYLCTFVYNNQRYGVFEYYGSCFYYVSQTIDKHCEYIYNLTLEGDLNVPLLKSSPFLVDFRNRFFKGNIRVANGGIQRMLLDVFG